MNVHVSLTKEQVAQEFAQYLVSLSKEQEVLHIALSGGSTPKIVFDLLASRYKDLDWSKFHFYWGDERCVDPSDAQSNYKMTVDHLFSKISIPEENIHRIYGENDPQLEAIRYADLLEKN